MIWITLWRWLRVALVLVICLPIVAAVSVVGLVFYWDWAAHQSFAHDISVGQDTTLRITGDLWTDSDERDCITTSDYKLIWPDGKIENIAMEVRDSRSLMDQERSQNGCQLAPAPAAQLRIIGEKHYLAVDGRIWGNDGIKGDWTWAGPDLNQAAVVQLARDFGARGKLSQEGYEGWREPDGTTLLPAPKYRVRADSKGSALDLERPLTTSGLGWPPRLQFRLDKKGEWQLDRAASVKLSRQKFNPFWYYQVDFVWVHLPENVPVPAQFERNSPDFPIRDFPNSHIAMRETRALGTRSTSVYDPSTHIGYQQRITVIPRTLDSGRTRLQWQINDQLGAVLTGSQLGRWMTPAKRARRTSIGNLVCFVRVTARAK